MITGIKKFGFIEPEAYKECIEEFSKINLDSHWVYFSNVEVRGTMGTGKKAWRESVKACLPKKREKPYKIIRLVRRIFFLLFGGTYYCDVAQNLQWSIQHLLHLSKNPNRPEISLNIDRDLLIKIKNISSEILKKLKKADPTHEEQIGSFQVRIKESFDEHIDLEGS